MTFVTVTLSLHCLVWQSALPNVVGLQLTKLDGVQQVETLDFDRFGEEALRSVYFARRAVSELGGTSVTPDHLLLGLIVSIPQSIGRFLSSSHTTEEALHEIRSKLAVNGGRPATTDNVPLSNRASHVLTRAADEAGPNRAQPEHILLALLLDGDASTVSSLTAWGISTDAVRRFLRPPLKVRDEPSGH